MIEEKLVDASAAVPASEAPETLISWESQSCDALRAIASRGAHGGELYFAAVKELERRAHDTETAIEDQQNEIAAWRRGQIWWLAVLIAAISTAIIARVLSY
ncbi:MAG TPA: hypothetical protein VKC17_01660 [Sphingomicrobium sp.]|nr:hypothetical protein [Sphingomicrobium sp.]